MIQPILENPTFLVSGSGRRDLAEIRGIHALSFREWNAKINLVSRKDTERLEIKHIAHCLTITKFLRLMPKARILDVGTGGGLPGIPLSICYPQARFTLMDSVGKKVMVVEDMIKRLELSNVEYGADGY